MMRSTQTSSGLTKGITSSLIACAAFVLLMSTTALQAKVSPDQVAKLNAELTPLGAVRAGNANGSIPAWDGSGIQIPASYSPGMHHPDPFPEDKILFTVSKKNADQYQDHLTLGQMALLQQYDTFHLNVYQTRRTAAYPDFVYAALKVNAGSAELVAGGNGVINASITSPFPIPQNAQQVIWNHNLRYRKSLRRFYAQAAPTRSGRYTIVKFQEDFFQTYSTEGLKPSEVVDPILFFKQKVISPARLSGTALLAHEAMNQSATPRQAWRYNAGQRRVRRAPNVAFDFPGTASDGMRTTDDFDMFNGSLERYNWKMLGKKEIFLAYNSYKIHSDQLEYKDILGIGHLNPDLSRYELHRVWAIEATLKEGVRHTYAKRVFYLDEDSWQVAAQDIYDKKGNLFRTTEAHIISYYEVPQLWTTLDVNYDLPSGRYLVIGLDNQDKMYDFAQGDKFNLRDFTPAALRREGKR